MTIQDAIKSGRPFRRPHYKWFHIENGFPFAEDNSFVNLSQQDILAEDWETKAEPVVFECIWGGSAVVAPCSPLFADPTVRIQDLLGKRTRVTVEVIE